MKNEILKDYLVNKTIDIDKIIDDFYGYVYMITKNGASIYITDEDIMDNYFFYIIINCSYDVFSYIRRK